jgi:hypothetical protein
MTELNLAKALWEIKEGGETLLVDSWREGLRQVKTPYVCLVEGDCVLSAAYLKANYGIMKKYSPLAGGKGSSPSTTHGGKREGSGGYTKIAMLASCLGVKKFDNRIYNYHLKQVVTMEETTEGGVSIAVWGISPVRRKFNIKTYDVQVGFVPGAIMRMSVVRDIVDDFDWEELDLVKLSTRLSFYLWDTGRRVHLNPNTTYVSNLQYLEKPPLFDPEIPDKVSALFSRESIT